MIAFCVFLPLKGTNVKIFPDSLVPLLINWQLFLFYSEREGAGKN